MHTCDHGLPDSLLQLLTLLCQFISRHILPGEATRCAHGVRAVQRHGRVETLALFQLVVDDVTARSKAASGFLPGHAASGKGSRPWVQNIFLLIRENQSFPLDRNKEGILLVFVFPYQVKKYIAVGIQRSLVSVWLLVGGTTHMNFVASG